MNLILRKIKWIKNHQIVRVFMVLLISHCLSAHADESNLNSVTIQEEPITITVGESEIISTQLPTVRVAVTDPKIADVTVLTPYQILLQGLKVGSTDLIIWSDDEKNIQRWKVRIVLDVANYKKKLDELFPHSSLQVSESGETLIVKGLLRSANQAEQLHDFLDKSGVTYVDMTSVAGVQQVQLQVRFAEVSRAAIRALGINAFHTDDDFFGAVRVGSLGDTSIGVPKGTTVGDDTVFQFLSDAAPATAVTIFGGIPRADFEFFIKALAENQYLRILANPTLVALSGEEASFLAGGEFPIPVPQTGGAGAVGQAITIQYKQYGVSLLFRPIVLGDGTIRLFVAPEVSELSAVGEVEIGGYPVPSLLTRKFETTLELNSGQTFAMAGLIKHKAEAINSRIPGLGDLPVLGPLFRSVRYREDETELVVLVTVSLVEPMSLATEPLLPGFLHTPPDDWEFYLEGRIEGKKPAKIHPANAERLKQLGLDKLMGPGAWESYGQEIPSSQAELTITDSNDIDTQGSQGNEITTDSSSANLSKSSLPAEEK